MKEVYQFQLAPENLHQIWTPKIIGELNGQDVKLAKVKGEFVWHDHKGEDELFLIVKDTLRIEFRNRSITLNESEILIIPFGITSIFRKTTREEM